MITKGNWFQRHQQEILTTIIAIFHLCFIAYVCIEDETGTYYFFWFLPLLIVNVYGVVVFAYVGCKILRKLHDMPGDTRGQQRRRSDLRRMTWFVCATVTLLILFIIDFVVIQAIGVDAQGSFRNYIWFIWNFRAFEWPIMVILLVTLGNKPTHRRDESYASQMNQSPKSQMKLSSFSKNSKRFSKRWSTVRFGGGNANNAPLQAPEQSSICDTDIIPIKNNDGSSSPPTGRGGGGGGEVAAAEQQPYQYDELASAQTRESASNNSQVHHHHHHINSNNNNNKSVKLLDESVVPVGGNMDYALDESVVQVVDVEDPFEEETQNVDAEVVRLRYT